MIGIPCVQAHQGAGPQLLRKRPSPPPAAYYGRPLAQSAASSLNSSRGAKAEPRLWDVRRGSEEAVRELRRTAFSSRCRPIAGSPKRKFVKPQARQFWDETRANRLIAAALLARDCAAVAPFDRSGHHAAVLPWADGDTARADADGDI